MKKYLHILIASSFILALVLAGCGASSFTTTAGNRSQTTGELSEATQLAVGILKLKDGDLKVDKTQAAVLLPLWKAYKFLLSDTASAQSEKDAVTAQIKASMTAEQIQAITDMNLAQADVQAAFQQNGADPNATAASGTSTQTSEKFTLPQGGAAGGGPGGGGGPVFIGGPDGGIDAPPMNAQSGSASSTQVAPSSTTSVNPLLINLVIRYLESLTAAN